MFPTQTYPTTNEPWPGCSKDLRIIYNNVIPICLNLSVKFAKVLFYSIVIAIYYGTRF